ncbi:uncharacterized protein LOC133204935 [Saccostrea echinata]|uniref:uncharacterized protein LOC133204935 n=1 Tax=Saccostrea echinata TaxID=191078 RepID=UPI002A818770|nr:uncharacterized protein LOC133204935 [Saccostrea echinata]
MENLKSSCLSFNFSCYLALIDYTPLDVTCPPNWTQHPTYKNLCYRLGTKQVKYSSVDEECSALLTGATVASVYNVGIHKFLADSGFLSTGLEYYTGLVREGWRYVFSELNSEPLGDWNEWGSIPWYKCSLYEYRASEWKWKTNNCNKVRLYICQYIVPTPGTIPVVLVDGDLMSGRAEIFTNDMWGTLQDSAFSGTGIEICEALGYGFVGTRNCAGVTCGTGKVWYERVNCASGAAVSFSNCLTGLTPSDSDDHSKDLIVQCQAPEPTTAPNPISTMPITSDNNVTGCNCTVTVYVTPASSACLTGNNTANPNTTKVSVVYDALPTFNAKDTAKYSMRTRYDNRASAKAMGSFGILIIIGLMSFIVVIDLWSVGMRTLRLRGLCKGLCKKKKSVNTVSKKIIRIERLLEPKNKDARSSLSTKKSLTKASINHKAKTSYVEKNVSINQTAKTSDVEKNVSDNQTAKTSGVAKTSDAVKISDVAKTADVSTNPNPNSTDSQKNDMKIESSA